MTFIEIVDLAKAAAGSDVANTACHRCKARVNEAALCSGCASYASVQLGRFVRDTFSLSPLCGYDEPAIEAGMLAYDEGRYELGDAINVGAALIRVASVELDRETTTKKRGKR